MSGYDRFDGRFQIQADEARKMTGPAESISSQQAKRAAGGGSAMAGKDLPDMLAVCFRLFLLCLVFSGFESVCALSFS